MARYWWPSREARTLDELEVKNLKDRATVNDQLRHLDEALANQNLVEHERADLRARRTEMEHHRTGILDDERTLATRRQTLILQSTARATWAAAAAAVSPLFWEGLRLLLKH